MTTFEPSFDLIQENDCNTLLLYLPGFTKEELRVQLTKSRVLKISGTRAIGDNKWSSFHKDFPVPENCDTSKISAKFEEGILYVRQPKVIVPAEDKITPPSPPPKPAPAPKIDPPPNHDGPKTGPSPDDSKQEEPVKDFPEKQSNKDEKVTGRKKDENRKATAGKSEKVSGVGKVGGYSVVNAAGRLKMEREKVMKIMLFVFAFGLGMYVSNKLPNWFSRNV